MTETTGTETGTVAVAAPADTAGHTESATPETQEPRTYTADEYAALEGRYKGLQSVWTKDHGELLNLKKTPPTAEVQPSGEDAPFLSQIEKVVGPLQQKLEQLELQSTLDKLRSSNPDTFDEIAPSLSSIFEEIPSLWGARNPVDAAYEIAEARHIKKNLPSVVQRAREQESREAAARQAGSDMKTRNGAPPAGPTAEEDRAQRIVNASKGRGSIFG